MRPARTIDAPSRYLPDDLLTAILALPREALARLIERMIDRLDAIDGNPDLEDDDPAECEARDDGCGPITVRGQLAWDATSADFFT